MLRDFDPFEGAGDASPQQFRFFRDGARRASADLQGRAECGHGFEKLVAEAEMDLGRLRECSVRRQSVSPMQQWAGNRGEKRLHTPIPMAASG